MLAFLCAGLLGAHLYGLVALVWWSTLMWLGYRFLYVHYTPLRLLSWNRWLNVSPGINAVICVSVRCLHHREHATKIVLLVEHIQI